MHRIATSNGAKSVIPAKQGCPAPAVVMGWGGDTPAVNIHHLELFYHVARHGGISRAVRHMPYGIQQPAVSGQMRLLEQGLGVRLFERTPFRLTAEGSQLFAFVESFFDNL